MSITLYGLNNQGGVIISPLHILTAAHPFLIFDKSQIGACFVTGYKTVAKIALKTVRIGSDCTAVPGSYSYSICQAKHMQRRNVSHSTILFNLSFNSLRLKLSSSIAVSEIASALTAMIGLFWNWINH